MINQEEYEILKGLDDKWKWIARDKNKKIWIYTEKPYKGTASWGPVEICGPLPRRREDLFQFIQWEDEEPHYIPDLISDYEGSVEYACYKINEVFSRVAEAIGDKLEGEEVEEEPLYRARLRVITDESIASYLRTQSSDAEDRLKVLEIGSKYIHEDYRHLSEFTENELKRLGIWGSEQWEVEELEVEGEEDER